MSTPTLDFIKHTAKAVVAAVVVAAAYLVGVIPAEGGFGDVTTVQWLGLVVFMGGAYGITYAVPNAPALSAGKRRKMAVEQAERNGEH